MDGPWRPSPRRPFAGWPPAAATVVDLADEPVLPAGAKLRLAALALHLGLAYEAPGACLEPPSYSAVAFAGPKLAVIGTGKRLARPPWRLTGPRC